MQGKSEEQVVADHPHLPAKHVKIVLRRLKSQHAKITGSVQTESTFTGYKSLLEINDNDPLTPEGWAGRVAHHERKSAFHKNLHDRSPDGSAFKKMHYDLWQHHEDQANKAKFQHRKYQILNGED